jgi:hypothetical protein
MFYNASKQIIRYIPNIRLMSNITTEQTTVQRLERTLPWFRIVFGFIGLVKPRLLGRWYGIYSPEGDGPNEVAIRAFFLRAFGLGIGRITASPAQRQQWKRISLLVDSVDTFMLVYAGLTGKMSKKHAVLMLSGTVFAMVTGGLSEMNR